MTEEQFKVMSKSGGSRMVRASRFLLKPRDQGRTRKPLTAEWLERYGNPNSRIN